MPELTFPRTIGHLNSFVATEPLYIAPQNIEHGLLISRSIM